MDFQDLKKEGERRDSRSCARRLSLNAERAKRRSSYLFTALACGGNSTSKYGRRQSKGASVQSASVGSSFMKIGFCSKIGAITVKASRICLRASPAAFATPNAKTTNNGYQSRSMRYMYI